MSDTAEPVTDDRPSLLARPKEWQPRPFTSIEEVTFYVVTKSGRWAVDLGGWMECEKP